MFGFAAMGACGGIEWRTSLEAAVREAKASNKLVMVFVYADFCDWCKKMKTETFPNDRVIAATRRVVPVKLNYDHEGKAFGKKYSVKGFPVFVFIDPKGAKFGEMFGHPLQGRAGQTRGCL
jgi:thiol:disulfide interchange protein